MMWPSLILVFTFLILLLINITELANAQQFVSNLVAHNYPQHETTGIDLTKSQHDVDYYYPEVPNNNNINGNSNNNNNNLNQDGAVEHSHQLPSLSHFNQFGSHQVLDKEYLSHDLAEKSCRLDRGCQRKDRLNNTFLSYCTRYKLENLLSNEILMSIMHDSSDECEKILDEFIQLDELINQFDRLFNNLLTRYNCHNGYSVKWSCDDCKKAYKDWLCATNLPYYMNGERIKPCISFCERVEQRCPYLHPITKEQYGGQPVFICRDPNIPFVPEITPDIPYSEPSKCYDLCHLSNNSTELIIDSLSKYHYDKCPDKGSIAEEVRSDVLYCQMDLQTRQQNNRSRPNSETDDQFEHNGISSYTTTDSTSKQAIPNNESIPLFDDQHNNKHETAVTTTVVGKSTAATGSTIHVHNKKLNELREVLTIYKSQPKTHSFGHHSEHSSVVDSHHHDSVSKPHNSQLSWMSTSRK